MGYLFTSSTVPASVRNRPTDPMRTGRGVPEAATTPHHHIPAVTALTQGGHLRLVFDLDTVGVLVTVAPVEVPDRRLPVAQLKTWDFGRE